MTKVMSNFTMGEWMMVAGLGAAGNAVGWLGGKF